MSIITQFRNIAKKSELLKQGYYKVRMLARKTVLKLSPLWFVKFRYRTTKGSWPDLNNPKTFDEKLIWLMLYWQHGLKSYCGDKYTLRLYVKENGLEEMLPNLINVYEKSEDIDFDALPDRFVLKCSHGCKFNIICKDKNNLDVKETKKQLNEWMVQDFSKMYGELHYAEMKPRIICEEFLDDLNSDLPNDYKLYCFDGKVHCTMTCTARTLNGSAVYDFYDKEWSSKLPYSKSSLLANRQIPKPESYEEMVRAAEILSKPFPFVRVDFYSINRRPIIGEMTFTPAGCIDPGDTDDGQRILGNLIALPKPII